MRASLFILALFALTCGAAIGATSVSKSNSWSKTYAVTTDTPTLEISNVWGGVKVRPGKSGEIVVSVSEDRSAPNQRLFDRSLEIIKLNVESSKAGLSMKVGNPDDRWQGMNSCDECRVEYQFEVQVPVNTLIDVSTVLDGLVDVKGIRGVVSASNVNGSVRVDDIHNCDSIESVNGKIDVGFKRAPSSDCSVETINGDITLNLPANTNLDVAVDLFNGDIRSDFSIEPFSMPATIEHKTKDGSNRYRIKQLSGVRIGANGPVYSIASMNGDVRIQKNQ